MTKQCAICIEPFNKSSRKPVTCTNCSMDICRECINTFVMDSTQEAHCMNCKVRYTDSFMRESFTKKWTNQTYHEHRVKLIMQRERSLLPSTEQYAIEVSKYHKFSQLISEKKNKIKELRQELQSTIRECRNIEDERWRQNYVINDAAKGIKTETRKFVMPCIHNNCKGYLNNKYVCGTCELKVCSKCHKEKNDNHECSENDLKTVEEIKKSCKPCPKCGIQTHKISGCPQMWCVNCHEVWDWRTGESDRSGVVHNPHYFQYLTRQRNDGTIPRQQGDVRCGGNVTELEIRYARYNKWNTIKKDPQHQQDILDLYAQVLHIYRVKTHIQYTVLPRYTMTDEKSYRDLRCKYLRNVITEDEWIQQVKKDDKIHRRVKDYNEVIQLHLASMEDILKNCVDSTDPKPYIDQLPALTKYTQSILDEMSKRYKVAKVYGISG